MDQMTLFIYSWHWQLTEVQHLPKQMNIVWLVLFTCRPNIKICKINLICLRFVVYNKAITKHIQFFWLPSERGSIVLIVRAAETLFPLPHNSFNKWNCDLFGNKKFNWTSLHTSRFWHAYDIAMTRGLMEIKQLDFTMIFGDIQWISAPKHTVL